MRSSRMQYHTAVKCSLPRNRVRSVRSQLRLDSRRRDSSMVKRIAQSGFLFGSPSPFVAVPNCIKPNKRFEFVPYGHPTRKSDALLLAAQADR